MPLEIEIDSDTLAKIENYIYAGMEKGSRYKGMTYEQGMQAVIDYLKGDSTLEELIEE